MSIYMSRAELEEISEGLITAYANKFSKAQPAQAQLNMWLIHPILLLSLRQSAVTAIYA